MMDQKLERILKNVQKPARYTGGEYKQTVKDKNSVSIRVALCFPDTYEIGMSNLGMRIIYGVLNSIGDVWCERVFAPWGDMEEQMRRSCTALYGLESGEAISSFDIVAFSIGYELSYTTILNMLDLAGIPLRAADRTESGPLVIAGGTCCFNPEPLADFFDLFVIGDGEDVICEIIEQYRSSGEKRGFPEAAAAIPGVYVPSLYDVAYNDDGTIGGITPREGAAFPVEKRVVGKLDESFFPVETIVPSTGIVHDRVVLELFRGCIHGCRFCQAGHVYRPVRSRSLAVLTEQGIGAIKNSGYDEIALLSLSSSDYEEIIGLCDGLLDWCEPRKVSLSLPSLRADNFSFGLMQRIQKVRKSGLTFAPEAGSQRLRDVINKNVTEEDLLNTCRSAFEGGWNSVKLYFMLGLPTETDEDVVAIANLSREVFNVWKRHTVNKSRGVRITVSTSCFIPKPHTPFQWEPQIAPDEYLRRVALLKEALRSKSITYNWHESQQSYIEAALARGDRRLGRVIEIAWKEGARLDSWSEYFVQDRWETAFAECGLDPDFYAGRERQPDEQLPWSVISSGISERHLINERGKSRNHETTPDCRKSCSGCGASACMTGAGADYCPAGPEAQRYG